MSLYVQWEKSGMASSDDCQRSLATERNKPAPAQEHVRQRSISMKIMILTIGTRGDVQPYIALGRALMASGHEITICTCAHFEPFIREYGLGYAYVNNDFIDFMHSPEGKIILGNAGSFWETLTSAHPQMAIFADFVVGRKF